MKTFLIILITSLFWAMGIYIDRNYSEAIKSEIREWTREEVVEEVKEEVIEIKEDIAESKAIVSPKKATHAPKPQPKVEHPKAIAKNYAELICGYWEPIEEASQAIEFNKYGIFKRYIEFLDTEITKESPYLVNGSTVTLTQHKENVSFPIKIYSNKQGTFLEIYDITQISGKYKKGQKASETQVEAEKGFSTSQPAPTIETKPENRAIPLKNGDSIPEVSEDIIGKWLPVDGAKHPIEISRYGTIIQWWSDNNNSRYRYTVKGSMITIGYNKECRFEITHDKDKTYLEIYNNNSFSGKYVKQSSHYAPSGQIIPQSELSEAIVGKWEPVIAAEHTIEITRYGTIIQWWSVNNNSRYDYTLTGNQLDIGYNKCEVEVVKSEYNTYLEIYHNDEFSGLYRKIK